MAEYPSSIKVEIYTTTWVDISAYVVKDIVGDYGINNGKLTDRVASTGTLKISLNNIGGKFSPDKLTTITGFNKGIPVRLSVIYRGETIVKFYGHIENIDLDSSGWGERLTRITVVDWMNYASNYPITLNSVLYNKRIDEAVYPLVTSIPVQPFSTQYNSGVDVFPTVFDTGKGNTKASSEFQKLAVSEWGYIYLRKDRTYGEKLVVENRWTRRPSTPLTSIPTSTKIVSNLLMETGDSLLLEIGDNIHIDEIQAVNFSNKMTRLKVEHGSNLINYIAVKNYPRRIDDTVQVLYSLTSPISLGAGETKDKIKVKYRDPLQLATKVSGVNMITPVATTDYQMYQTSIGTGVNRTANLTVSVVFGSNDAEISLTNSGTENAHVTKLDLRGYGIYVYETLEFIESDTSSINTNGYSDLIIDQKYQGDDNVSQGLAQVLLSEEKTPRTVLKEVEFLANVSDELMSSFLFYDIGDLIYVKEDQTGIDGFYFIQGVKFKITQGKIITFSFVVTQILNLDDAYWILGIPWYSELESTTILAF